MSWRWLHQVAVALDQVANAVLGGYADETLSARMHRGGTPRRDSATVRFGMHETSSRPVGGTTKPSKSEPSAATSSPPTDRTCSR